MIDLMKCKLKGQRINRIAFRMPALACFIGDHTDGDSYVIA